VPIRCEYLNPNDILQHLPATFTLRYLRFPLSNHRLERVDLQHLENKIASKLGSRRVKNVTTVGQRVLVRAVLTSQSVYHITSLELLREVLKKIKAKWFVAQQNWEVLESSLLINMQPRTSRKVLMAHATGKTSAWKFCLCHGYSTTSGMLRRSHTPRLQGTISLPGKKHQ
jgi:hypothetical protein